MSTDLLVINGPGVVARRGEAVLWAESSDLRREGLLAAVVAAMGEAVTGRRSPSDFATWLIGELSGARGSTIPALAFVHLDGDELLTVVHGWGRVTAPGGAVTATGSAIRIPATLPIAVGRGDLAVLASGDSLLGLVEGSVPGGAALLLQRTPTSAAAAAPAPAAAALAGAGAMGSGAMGSGAMGSGAPSVAMPLTAAPAAVHQPAAVAPQHAAPAPPPPPAAPPAPPAPQHAAAPPPPPQHAAVAAGQAPPPLAAVASGSAAPAAAPLPTRTPGVAPAPNQPPPGAMAPAPMAPAPMAPAPMAPAPMAPASPAPAPAPAPGPMSQVGPPSMLVSLRSGSPGADMPPREPLPIAAPGPAADPAQPGAPGPQEQGARPVPSSPRAAIVPGVNCSRQHFNNPSALYCRVCGISMLQQTHVRVDGERPPLGVLVCDDGATFGLDGDYAIGSDPSMEPGVTSGLAQPLSIGDLADGVAPTHVVIHLDGWDVHALNRSPNSPAAVLNRGDTQWTPLPPGQWAKLAPGSYVGFAGRHVVYESNNRA